MNKLTQKNFIDKAKENHGDKYDYSLVKYFNCRTKVKIICPIHGVFEQMPYIHLQGSECPKCAQIKRNQKSLQDARESFIDKAKEVHSDKYDYSLVNYKNDHTKVKITCPIHGVFEQSPVGHLKGNKCPKCANKIKAERQKLNTEEFIDKAKEIHGDKYDYSLVDYKDSKTKIKIICPVHGIFEQTPSDFLQHHGCQACVKRKRINTEEFIDKAKEVHGDKYDYSLVDYKNSHTKVKIICPIHGVFEQSPNSHLFMNGCPHCKKSKGEEKIRIILESNGYILNKTFFREYSFKDLKDKKLLRYDFYIPSKNLLIEYNGKQHYQIGFDKKRKTLLLNKHHDWLKRKYARKNNLKLEIIPYWEFKNIEKILENI